MKIDKIFESFCDLLAQREGIMTEDNIRYYWFASMYEKDKNLNHYVLEKPYERDDIFTQRSKKKSNNKNNAKKELDLLYVNGREQWAMEIKFHKNPIPNGQEEKTAYANPDAAGFLFNDILRLQFAPIEENDKSVRRLLLYVTDKEMHDYLLNNSNRTKNAEYRNEIKKFYEMNTTDSPQRFFTQCGDLLETFQTSAFSSFKKSGIEKKYYNGKDTLFPTPQIRLLQKNDDIHVQSKSFLGNECHVRLYEVLDFAKVAEK